MDSLDHYFASVCSDRRLLEAHGFDHWPEGEELARYLFEVEEKVDLLARLNGLQFARDARGRQHAYPLREVG